MTALAVVPLGDVSADDLGPAAALLGAAFPGVTVTVARPEPLPAGVYKVDKDAVVWEELQAKLREQPGVVYVTDKDLLMLDGGFAYARFDEKGRAVLSLSRLRSFVGTPTRSGALDVTLSAGVQNRLNNQLVNVAGKVLGLSYPCPEAACAMREMRSVVAAGQRPPALCARHQAELAARLQAGRK